MLLLCCHLLTMLGVSGADCDVSITVSLGRRTTKVAASGESCLNCHVTGTPLPPPAPSHIPLSVPLGWVTEKCLSAFRDADMEARRWSIPPMQRMRGLLEHPWHSPRAARPPPAAGHHPAQARPAHSLRGCPALPRVRPLPSGNPPLYLLTACVCSPSVS